MTILPPALLSLEERVARLEAIDAIRRLKARYAALADAKYTSDYTRQPDAVMHDVARQQAECFAHDAVWVGGSGFGNDLAGREALRGWFHRSPWRFAMHYYTSESIDVDVRTGTAHATWRLWQLALRDDDAHAVLLGAITEEKYAVDGAGHWLVSEMRFVQLKMMEPSAIPFPIANEFGALAAMRTRATTLTE
jgi:hypothetical protein